MPLWGYVGVVALVVAFVYLRRALRAPPRQDDSPAAGRIQSAFLVVFVLSMLVLGWSPWEGRDPLTGNPLAETVAEYTEEGDAVMFVATNTSAAFPLLVQMNRRPGSRFFVTWPIPLLYKGVTAGQSGEFPYRSGSDVTPEEARFLDELAEDVDRNRPRLIVVRQGSRNQACPEGFVLEDYLTAVGFVAQAMGDYLRAPAAGGYEVFVLSEGGSRR
jgi:hypothetical protein